MTTNDLILALRSRLGDEESKKWNDNELIDMINNAYINLARVLRLFLQKQSFNVSNENYIFNLPTNYLDIATIKTKNQNSIPIIRYREVLRDDIYTQCVSINNNQIIFNNCNNGIYEMYFYCYYIVVSISDELLLPEIAFNAMLCFTMFLLLQKKPSQTSLQDAQYYKALYEEEITRLQRDIYRSYETKYLTSRFILV